MKTIEFEGKKYEVEDWVNWVARDCDGEINGYEKEPNLKPYYDFWTPEIGSRWCYIDDKRWQDSLTKV